jgi:hypothetical protein
MAAEAVQITRVLLKTAKSAVLEMPFRIEMETCGYKKDL